MVTAFINTAIPPGRIAVDPSSDSSSPRKKSKQNEDDDDSSNISPALDQNVSLYDEESMKDMLNSAVREGQGVAVVQRLEGCSLRDGASIDSADLLKMLVILATSHLTISF